ncbi:MAG: hypothetical protein J5I91_05580 [Bacteroidetes bacterium]|nr:hypothetical protein [Bacteroidota bacterium]
MKKITLPLILISAFTISTFYLTSCKKDKKEEEKKETPKPPTNEELVMANTWKITKFMSQGIDVWNNNVFPIFESCQKDNTYQFQKDNLLLIDEGETKCDSADAQTMEGAWYMVGKDKMFIDVVFLSDTADIISVSKSQLVLKANVESFGVEGEITFNKID